MRILRHDQIDSTSSQARRMAEAGDFGPVWIQADSQTQGRGRRGRNWASAGGNLYCTHLVPHTGPLASAAQLSFVAAIAVSALCEIYAPDIKAGLKWPNDVRIDGAKVAGILLESGRVGDQVWVSIGIGVNLINAPDNMAYPVTNIASHMDTSDPEAIPDALSALATLAGQFEHWFDIWTQHGFEPIRKAWLARTDGLGKTVTAKQGDKTLIGTMTGLSPTGELTLRLPDGEDRRISSGEISIT